MPVKVELEMDEWNRVLAMLATQPWVQANPIIMRLAEQLRLTSPAVFSPRPDGENRSQTAKTQ